MSVTLRAARAHHRERFVAGRVEEHDVAIVDRDVIGADVLRDAAGLALGDARLADGVEQRRLAVVDVAHDRDDRRARDDVLRPASSASTCSISSSKLCICTSAPNSRAIIVAVLVVERRVDRHHLPLLEQLLQHVLYAGFELVGQILTGSCLRQA